jgi:hypothetical protein
MGQQVIVAEQQLTLQACSTAFSNFNYISTIKFVCVRVCACVRVRVCLLL